MPLTSHYVIIYYQSKPEGWIPPFSFLHVLHKKNPSERSWHIACPPPPWIRGRVMQHDDSFSFSHLAYHMGK